MGMACFVLAKKLSRVRFYCAFGRVIEASDEIDILLLGMGSGMKPLPAEWRIALRKHGIVVEPMDTGAACRTYNVLVSEARRVAAALISV